MADPIKKTKKTNASNPGSGKTTAQLVKMNDKWRSAYNPLRGLIMARVVAMLEAGERGEYADLQWLYRMVEKRYAILRGLIIRRLSALQKLDWDIKIVSELPEGATQAQAEAQQKFLRERYEFIGNLKEAIKFLARAEFRGYSILQKYYADGAVRELHWLPQWNFVRDGLFGAWYWNPDARQTAAVALPPENKIDPAEFIIREVEMPINEIAVLAFIRSNLSQKDYDAFIELFGLPNCIVEMPPGIPTGKEDEYRDAAEQVSEGASGALPNGAKPYFPSEGVRGKAPFKEHMEWQEKDVVMAGTGGKLSMLTASTGMNDGQGKSHADAFDDIAQAEAAEISELFNDQFDAGELAAAFPGQPILAYFAITAEDKEDVTALVANIAALATAGYDADPDQISEKTGLKITRRAAAPPPQQFIPGQPPLDNRRALRNRQFNQIMTNAEDAYAQAQAKTLAPLLKRVQMISEMTDFEAQKAELAKLNADLPDLQKQMNLDPESAKVLIAAMSEAMCQGLKGNKP